MKKTLLVLLTLVISFSFVSSTKALYTDASVGTYEQELSKFPCDYQNKIKQLHNTYPNAVFVAQNIFFDWDKKKEVPVNWNDMVQAEDKLVNGVARSSIYYTAPASYRTSACDQTSGGKCVWYRASVEGIKYYLNPYNFLDTTHVFMFESQLYNPNQTVDGLEKLLAGTFMSNKNCPGSNKTYAQVIIEAAQKYSLSAYMLASRIKQEQGSAGTSGLISGNYSGYVGYYNYFNIKASGSTDAEVIKNGLEYAKSQGWTSPYLAITGGASFLRSKYIGANDQFGVKGQMTDYLQKWDPYGPQYGGQQYMQNIMAPYSESASTYKAYSSISGYNNLKYVFYIPIFTGAPNTTNTSCNAGTSIKKGDVNGDGKVSSADYLMIRDYIMGSYNIADNYKLAADVTGDGKVTSADYLKIRDYIMGVISSL